MINDDEIKRLADENDLITPFNMELLNPHSYDCTLGNELKIAFYGRTEREYEKTKGGILYEEATKTIKTWEIFDLSIPKELSHGMFALGGTIEYFKLPQDVVGFVQGKSTVGRNGLQIECAGLIDAGFEGNITLEFFNMAPWPIELKYGQKICQVHFTHVDSPLYKDYSIIGHYNKQQGATEPVYAL